MDFLVVKPGETLSIADINGAGCINHIWCTHACSQEDYLRRLVLRARWDNESGYSIDVLLGDFFGVGHTNAVDFISPPLQMSPSNGRSCNCWSPRAFSSRAEFFLLNEAEIPKKFYYCIDNELHDRIPEDIGRFPAQYGDLTILLHTRKHFQV